MKLNLTDEILPDQKELFKKVLLFTEDSRARWFIKKMINISDHKSSLASIRLADVSMPWSSLANLAKESISILPKSIFIFDPDLSNKKTQLVERISGDFNQNSEALQVNSSNGRVFILPGKAAIEKVLWDYVSNLNSEDAFFEDPIVIHANLEKRLLLQNSPENLEKATMEKSLSDYKKTGMSIQFKNSQTDKYKIWAEHMGTLIETICDYWIKANIKDVNTFTNTLYKSVLN